MSLPPSSAPTATGWSDSCRAGFAPAGEWHLVTAHRDPTLSGYPPRVAAFPGERGPPLGRCGLRIRRSASTSASAQSPSIVVVAGRMVRVRRQVLDEPADQVLCARGASSRSRSATAGPAGPPRVAAGRTGPTSAGYARVSKSDGYQSLDLQRDALRAAGVNDAVNLYHDFASGLRDDRPGLDSCLRVLRKGDVLMVWKLDRLGRNLAHLVVGIRSAPPGRRAPAGPRRGPTDPARCLTRGRPARVRHLRGAGRVRAGADPRTHRGRAQGRTGPWSQGREEVRAVAKAQVRLAQVAMAHRDTSVSALCRELGIRPVNALPVLVATVNFPFVATENRTLCWLAVAGLRSTLLSKPTARRQVADARMGDEDAAEALSGTGRLEGGVGEALRGESPDAPRVDRVEPVGPGPVVRGRTVFAAAARTAQAGPLRRDHRFPSRGVPRAVSEAAVRRGPRGWLRR